MRGRCALFQRCCRVTDRRCTPNISQQRALRLVGRNSVVELAVKILSFPHLTPQMLSERDAMKRQSAVLINSAMSDQRLAEALLKIEDLTKEVDSQKEQLKGKVNLKLPDASGGFCLLETFGPNRED